jgi:hypothetical protein
MFHMGLEAGETGALTRSLHFFFFFESDSFAAGGCHLGLAGMCYAHVAIVGLALRSFWPTKVRKVSIIALSL